MGVREIEEGRKDRDLDRHSNRRWAFTVMGWAGANSESPEAKLIAGHQVMSPQLEAPTRLWTNRAGNHDSADCSPTSFHLSSIACRVST
jgi:hypothetical protein